MRSRGRVWNCPVAPLAKIEVQRKDYVAVVLFLAERGIKDIFCSDKGIWLLPADVDAIEAVRERFEVRVFSSCPPTPADELLHQIAC